MTPDEYVADTIQRLIDAGETYQTIGDKLGVSKPMIIAYTKGLVGATGERKRTDPPSHVLVRALAIRGGDWRRALPPDALREAGLVSEEATPYVTEIDRLRDRIDMLESHIRDTANNLLILADAHDELEQFDKETAAVQDLINSMKQRPRKPAARPRAKHDPPPGKPGT